MIVAKKSASQRTKNRMRDHELVRKFAHSPLPIFDGKPHECFLCKNCRWIGWLPIDEIEEI